LYIPFQALTYRSFKRTNSLLASPSPRVSSPGPRVAFPSPRVASPRIDEESLLAQRIAEESPGAPPLLGDKKIKSSKAPFVVLGELYTNLNHAYTASNLFDEQP
jgi:hypothetical protein